MFISLVLDMENLILDTLSWANATEKKLCEKGEIHIAWDIPTEILYAENDNLISHKTVGSFAR